MARFRVVLDHFLLVALDLVEEGTRSVDHKIRLLIHYYPLEAGRILDHVTLYDDEWLHSNFFGQLVGLVGGSGCYDNLETFREQLLGNVAAKEASATSD